jgi:hypothetical protein
MSDQETLRFRFPADKRTASLNVTLPLEICNPSRDDVANLCFRIVSGSQHGLRVLGTSARQDGLYIPAGERRVISVRVGVAAGRHDVTLDGISYRYRGGVVRPANVTMAVEFVAEAPAAPRVRTLSHTTPLTARDVINRPPFDSPPGFGSRIFVSFSGQVRRRAHLLGEDWLTRVLNAFDPVLKDLSAKAPPRGSNGLVAEPFRLFTYNRPDDDARVGDEWKSGLARVMYEAPAAILILSSDYPASSVCWEFEAPYLVWRALRTGMPLVPIRINDMPVTEVRYPDGEADAMFDLTALYDDRKGAPDLLASPYSSDSLQHLRDNHQHELINTRLNGIARQLAARLRAVADAG